MSTAYLANPYSSKTGVNSTFVAILIMSSDVNRMSSISTMRLEYQINKAKGLISALPIDEKQAIEAYIDNLKNCLERERQLNKEYQEVFDKIKKFTII